MPEHEDKSNSDVELVASAEEQLLEAAREIECIYDKIDASRSLFFALFVALILLVAMAIWLLLFVDGSSSSSIVLFAFIILVFAACVGVVHRARGLVNRARYEVGQLKRYQAVLTGFVGFENEYSGVDSKESQLFRKVESFRLRRIDEVTRRGG